MSKKIENFFRTILIGLWIVQGRHTRSVRNRCYEQIRLNPWNPLSYPIYASLVLVCILFFGVQAVNEENWLVHVFYWH